MLTPLTGVEMVPRRRNSAWTDRPLRRISVRAGPRRKKNSVCLADRRGTSVCPARRPWVGNAAAGALPRANATRAVPRNQTSAMQVLWQPRSAILVPLPETSATVEALQSGAARMAGMWGHNVLMATMPRINEIEHCGETFSLLQQAEKLIVLLKIQVESGDGSAEVAAKMEHRSL